MSDRFAEHIAAAVKETLRDQGRELDNLILRAMALQDPDKMDRLHVVTRIGYWPGVASRVSDDA